MSTMEDQRDAALEAAAHLAAKLSDLRRKVIALLDVINFDDDGDMFICKEAAPTVNAVIEATKEKP